jgi:hypothetical protein
MDSQPQNPTFLTNWNKLPDELKLHVLSFALPVNQCYDAVDFSVVLRNQSGAYGTRVHDFETRLLPLLACSNIASMAYENYYKQNSMWFHPSAGLGSGLIPPANILPFVRRLSLCVRYDLKGLEFIVKLGSGDIGFANLHHVEIFIEYDQDLPDVVNNFFNAMQIVEMPTRSLHVIYPQPACYSGPVRSMPSDVLMEKLTIRPGKTGTGIKKRFERSCSSCGCRNPIFREWAEHTCGRLSVRMTDMYVSAG